jgi:hypothetical protein
VIETNATRIDALAAMFYSNYPRTSALYIIKMANYDQSRYEILEMLPEKIDAGDFERVVSIMTPNIDFGKSLPTPWEHILEVVKAAK